MRHAQTVGNIARRYIGATDEPLCAQGEKQAQAFAQTPAIVHLASRISFVYVSPLVRARQTATICFPAVSQRIISDLREMDFGEFEGYSFEELKDNASYRAWLDSGQKTCCPMGESQHSFTQRTVSAIRQILTESAQEGMEHVVVVAHGGTAMAALSELAIPSRSYFDWTMAHCQVYQAHVLDPSSETPQLTDVRLI